MNVATAIGRAPGEDRRQRDQQRAPEGRLWVGCPVEQERDRRADGDRGQYLKGATRVAKCAGLPRQRGGPAQSSLSRLLSGRKPLPKATGKYARPTGGNECKMTAGQTKSCCGDIPVQTFLSLVLFSFFSFLGATNNMPGKRQIRFRCGCTDGNNRCQRGRVNQTISKESNE
ncbi:hypothetical protein BDY21DRAFT_94630 [Lineolata rhizophorae]|uniref:Uncharacterized protein n=1 Tax=Lineolata rhizophorae TaxID=578093 RepID=A0A6A6NU50_9PEZI|nr:hypothetical protein BDY21DRAFT_94630 [Lineolata rhizophorae]